jgi:DNA-binding beta-propeller fold protein YncE
MGGALGPRAIFLALLSPWPALAAPPLEQLTGTSACVSETGTSGACADGVALTTARGVATSPDGLNVYVAASGSDAIAIFDRNPVTGAITQKAGLFGCISETGTGGLCADGVALDGADGIAVAPDGRHVYVASATSGAIAAFARDLDSGALAQLAGAAACINSDGSSGCTDGTALSGTRSVAVGADGRTVYAAANLSNAVAVFDRDLSTGALTQKVGLDGCISESGGACADGVALMAPQAIAVAPDGRSAYVASILSDAVAVFDIDLETGELTQKAGTDACVSEDGTGGLCADGVALDGVQSLAISPDGRHLYAGSSIDDSIAVFDRDLASGTLAQKAGLDGCVSDTGSGGACADVEALNNVSGLEVSPDGQALHVAAFSSGVTSLDRETDGTLSQHAGVAACWSDLGSGGACRDGVALIAPGGVAASRDGRHLYAATSQSNAVAVFTAGPLEYDIDGDGAVEALTDGLLLVRFAFGLTGGVLVTGAVDLANCVRCTAPLIEAYLLALGGGA